MIGILSQGRMGNQMFELAFVYAAAKKMKTDYFIYNHSSLHYFNLKENFEERNRKNIYKYISSNIVKKSRSNPSFSFKENPKWWLTDKGVNKNVFEWPNKLGVEDYLLKDIKDNTFYKGYFQSEEYFENCKDEIKQMFEVKKEYQDAFNETKKYLFSKKTVILHIRRTDYMNHGEPELGGKDIRLPVSYYKKALKQIENSSQYNIIFVSDDIEFVKREFGTAENYYYENNDEITDFQILMNADIMIMANSSYSWWAAWLNRKPEKIIYAPNYFLGFLVDKFYPSGIKVNSWNWINVN